MARSVSRFDRRQPSFKQQARVLVLCEDTKSSLIYLKDAARYFRSYAAVEITHCGKNDPLNIVKEAIQRRRDYDQVYCAIDRDRHEGFDAALALAAENARWLSVIVSYPCYEFWLLLHFRMTSSPYTGVGNKSAGDLVVKTLRDEDGMAEYDKGGCENLFDLLISRLPIARQRAVQVLHDAANANNLNPSTRIHELIALFEQLGLPQPLGLTLVKAP